MTRLLLDTHALLWWVQDDRRLSDEARRQIAEPSAIVMVSAVSIWEIAIKVVRGKLRLQEKDRGRLPTLIGECGFTELPVTAAHASHVLELPRHHSDPFDRLLVSQARLESAALVTADRALSAYNVQIMAAD